MYAAFKASFCIRSRFHLREKTFFVNIYFIPLLTKMSNFVPDISLLFQNVRLMFVITDVCIQVVSRLQGITAGGDFLGLCHQKSSYKHVSDFGWLRSYDRLNLRIEGNDY